MIKMKHLLVVLIIGTLYTACKSISMNVAVPDKFSANATQMKVSGLGRGKRRPRLSFGIYQTSKVKAGWIKSSGGVDRNSGFAIEERVMRIFKMSRENMTSNTRNKYQYTIQDGNLVAEVYCLERSSKEMITTKTPLGDFGETKNFYYSFSAAIVPQTIKDEPWQLEFYNSYDRRKDTARKWFDRPYVEREGYVTNGKIRIDIRPVITGRVVGKDGKETQTLARLLMAYELKIEGGLIGIVDVFNNNVWIYNDLDNDLKLIVASVSSAILMRRLDESNI
jgi:hypothetical protein